MRYFEIAGGFRLNISEEEKVLLDKAVDGLLAEELDERDTEVAYHMLSRGLLNRHSEDGKLYYTPNSLPDIGRF